MSKSGNQKLNAGMSKSYKRILKVLLDKTICFPVERYVKLLEIIGIYPDDPILNVVGNDLPIDMADLFKTKIIPRDEIFKKLSDFSKDILISDWIYVLKTYLDIFREKIGEEKFLEIKLGKEINTNVVEWCNFIEVTYYGSDEKCLYCGMSVYPESMCRVCFWYVNSKSFYSYYGSDDEYYASD